MKIIAIYDNVEEKYIDLTLTENIPVFIRQNLPFILRTRPLKDVEIYEVGNFDEKNGTVTTIEKVKHNWDEYKFPENKAENLAPLNLTENEIKKIFNEKEVKTDGKRKI